MRAIQLCVGMLALPLAACQFTGLVDTREDAPMPFDAPVDAEEVDADPDPPDARVDAQPDADPPDATPVCFTFPSEHVDACLMPTPTAGWHLTAGLYTYDTTDGSLSPGTAPVSAIVAQRDPSGPPVRVISVDSFEMDAGAVLTVIGSAPLVIASWSTMEIAGVIDAGSHRGGTVGAGSGTGECNAAAPGEDGLASGGSGGGGGGGFKAGGGSGGQGDSPPGPLGGAGGSAAGTPGHIRGGCGGAASGTAGANADPPSTPSTVSARGAGGGAIELTARTSIMMTGASVLAGGAGGGGAPMGSACGGGGGGSGGYIGLDAPTVSIDATTLAANGGGGGASALFVGTGNPGSDGRADASAAAGGAAQTCAPAGGNGGAGTSFAGVTATGNGACGGGGGGGATGFVMVFSPSFSPSGAVISPTPNVTP